MQKLLVVDDEPAVLYSLKKRFESRDVSVLTAETAGAGLELLEEEHPDVVILDVRLPDMSGMAAFDRIREIDPQLPVVIMTAYATTEIAIEATKRGAFEFLLKPVDFHQLRGVLSKAMESSQARRQADTFDDAEPLSAVDRIVGQSPPMQILYKTIGRIAPQDVTVLLLGESGTGKELVARAIYHHSKRADAPFLTVNCAALSESLLERELFGHEPGASAGADQPRIGKFEQVNGGTILLDEIGDMSGATQAKVLRLLQGGEFERVGGHETVRSDVRVIAATNHDLEAMVAAGTFRRDLYYRLNGMTITLPPLRERSGDIPLLVEYFIARFNLQLQRRIVRMAPEVLAILERYSWPGNVRELQNVVRYCMIHAQGDTITPDCLPNSSMSASERSPLPGDPIGGDFAAYIRGLLTSGQSDLYYAVQAEVDRILLREVLEHVHGNQVQASNLLGISRSTLRSKLGMGRPFDAHQALRRDEPDQAGA